MVGIIGCGYWGMNYIRVFSELLGPGVVVACDLNEDRLRSIQRRTDGLRTTSIDEVIGEPRLEAVVISTPAASHFALAKRCSWRGSICWSRSRSRRPRRMGPHWLTLRGSSAAS